MTGCSNQPTLQQWANSENLQLSTVSSQGYELALLAASEPSTGDSLHIYFGGDGQPWLGQQPADNPTGTGSLILRLMSQDPATAVYLGRPCYHLQVMPENCGTALWTSARYSTDVLDTMEAGVQAVLQRYQPESLVLIGHSGGGVIATLLGARLAQQQAGSLTVISLAANLDTDAWTRFHGHLPLAQSLNPTDMPPWPATLNVFHWQGSNDRVVPLSSLTHYREQHPEAEFFILEDCDHSRCWQGLWPQILEQSLAAEVAD